MLADQETDRPRLREEPLVSETSHRFRVARQLATQIETLLGKEEAHERYGMRLARALAADLADQLAKLDRNENSG